MQNTSDNFPTSLSAAGHRLSRDNAPALVSDHCYYHHDRPNVVKRILVVDRNYPNGNQRWIHEVPYEDRRCAECEKNRREAFFGGNDSSLVTRGEVKALLQEQAEEDQQAARDARKQRRKRLRRKASSVRKHEQLIRDVSSAYKGREYFNQLTARGERPPWEWQEQGCPDTYADAWEDPTWRQRVYDERYNVTRRKR